MFYYKNRNQVKMFDDIPYGNKHHHRALKNSIYHTFRTMIVGKLPVHMFKKYFTAEYGRKTKDVQAILGLFLLQAFRDMTDEEAIEAYSFNYAFVYALDLDEPDYLGARTYYYYREKLLGEGRIVFESILKTVAEKISLNAAIQRSDSTMVQTNLARMSRLELFNSTIKKFLAELKKKHPIIHSRLDNDILERYSPSREETWFAANKPSQYQECLLQAARDILSLIDKFKEHPKVGMLSNFALLERVAEEQIVQKDNDEIVVDVNQEIKGTAMTNPNDPDAHYNGHYKKVGYKANFTETCGKDKDDPNPNIITDVQVLPANTADSSTVVSTIDALEEKGLKPETILDDNGYDSDENHQELKEREIDFVCPPSGKSSSGLEIMDFELNAQTHEMISCPMDKPCIKNTVNKKTKKTTSYFDADTCRQCPHSHDCPIKITSKKARVEWPWSRPRIETRRRMFVEDEATKSRYRQRGGGESSFSVVKIKLGLDRLRRRTKSRTTLSIFLAAAALNILRTHNWVSGGHFCPDFSKIKAFWRQILIFGHRVFFNERTDKIFTHYQGAA